MARCGNLRVPSIPGGSSEAWTNFSGQISTCRKIAPGRRRRASRTPLADPFYLEERPPGAGPLWKLKQYAKILCQWRHFDQLIGSVIVLNSICLGWSASIDCEFYDPVDREASWQSGTYVALDIVEQCFLFIYGLELVMRFLARGRLNLRDPWVLFDCLLVFLGGVSQWVMPHIQDLFDSRVRESLSIFMVFRLLRILRLIRSLRFFPEFRTLWKLVQGLMHSASSMFSTIFLLCFTLYVFACIGVELITKNRSLRAVEGGIVAESFGSLPQVILTLTQFITLDSIAAIYGPLVRAQPNLFLYFMPIIIIVPIAMLNIVTAVVVENALKLGKDDDEMRRIAKKDYLERLKPEIRQAFKCIDEDQSGHLTSAEVSKSAARLPPVLQSLIRPEQLVEFFDTLDVDGSGQVCEQEFVEGMLHYFMSDIPIETQQMLRMLRLVKAKVCMIADHLQLGKASQASTFMKSWHVNVNGDRA